MKDFLLEISFDAADAALEELVQARLFFTPSTGNFTTETGGKSKVSAYFPSVQQRDAAAEQLAGLNVDLSRKERDRIDWLERYQQSLRPILIGKRFVVAPDATLIPTDGGRLPLIIPQQQAFGTGSHQSTALAIELLESIDLRGARGLDIGSGSGILRASQLDVEVQIHGLRHSLEGPERDVGIRRFEQRDLLAGDVDSPGKGRLRQAEVLPRPSKLEANGEDRSHRYESGPARRPPPLAQARRSRAHRQMGLEPPFERLPGSPHGRTPAGAECLATRTIGKGDESSMPLGGETCEILHGALRVRRCQRSALDRRKAADIACGCGILVGAQRLHRHVKSIGDLLERSATRLADLTALDPRERPNRDRRKITLVEPSLEPKSPDRPAE